MISECKAIRRHILTVSHKSGHGHIPTCFSVVEMLYAVYSTMRHDPVHPDWPERDIFILSKGHAALAHYCVLAQFGYFPCVAVETLGAYQSTFGCHADRHRVPGVEVSTGSLGHGIGLAVGMALAFQLRHSTRHVYTLIGDGESNEGSVWEALMVAANLRLNNLTVFFDNNNSQRRSMPITNPALKFSAFGCQTHEVDGHDVEALRHVMQLPHSAVKVIVANTIKGHGCSVLVNNVFEWHRKSPNIAQYDALIKELDA